VLIRDRLRPVIADLLNRNRTTPSSLKGGAFCVGIERPPDGEPWVQVKTGVLNIFYPSDDDPLTRLKNVTGLPEETTCAAWEPWKYATLEFSPKDPPAIAELIQELFVTLYDFPDDTEVISEIFEM